MSRPHRVGGQRAHPPLERAVEILEDGQWHFTEDVLTEVAKVVPPGKAIREVERIRTQRKGAPEQRHQTLSRERMIASGARAIARAALHNPSFERSGTGKEQLIRMVSMPKSIVEKRRLAETEALFDAHAMADQLLDHPVPRSLLDELEDYQMAKVIMVFIDRYHEEQALQGNIKLTRRY